MAKPRESMMGAAQLESSMMMHVATDSISNA
jgi:hypothetical protein